MIVNPAAGNGRAAAAGQRVSNQLEARGAKFDLVETKAAGHAVELAAEFLAAEPAGTILGVGGDGTVHELVQAFGRQPLRGSLCFVPAGGGNDAARTIGCPRRLEAAVDLALDGGERLLDLGACDGEFFFNGVGIGLDGETAARSKSFTRLKGLPAYLAAALATIARYEAPRFRIEAGDVSWEGRGVLCAVGNGPSCGGGFLLTPDARPDDGVLDACVLGEFGRLEMLVNLPRALFGGLRAHPKATFFRSPALTVHADRSVLAHADGEVRRLRFPAAFSLLPQAIRVKVPLASSAARS